MKKRNKIFLLIVINVTLIISTIFSWYFIITKDLRLDKNLLESTSPKIVFVDGNNNNYSSEIGEIEKISINDIPSHVKNAFIAVEDKRFYNHNGIDTRGISRALLSNIKNLSFKEGGSTISQQLIKNTHLTSEKTLKRKAQEVKLVRSLEKEYTKNQILEIYLNTIYFGEGCYGISQASNCYFNKDSKYLTISESAMLAGLIKAPTYYSPYTNIQNCLNRRNIVLSLMLEQKMINKNEYEKAIKEDIALNQEIKKDFSYNYLAKKEVSSIIDKMPYKSKVFYIKTYFDTKINEEINQVFNNCPDDKNSTILITNSKGKILAYKSTCGDVKRQSGSVLKPLAVYLPAIESGKYDSCSIINDEKINVNGYSPRNYNDKYYGNISLKKSLALSSNVCAVKVINEIGIDYSYNYLNKFDLEISENDKNLSLALGSTQNGIKLSKLVGAYNVFCNDGIYYKPTCIKEITNEKNEIIYKDVNNRRLLFNNDTTEIVREMLKETVKTGTAKKLNTCNFDIYAKTGTVGNKFGNTDAYSISFNKDYVLGMWLGGNLPNTITGGGLPCSYSCNIWKSLYREKTPPQDFNVNYAQKVLIDKQEYDNGKILLADNLAPKNQTIEELFRKNRVPKNKATNFSCPEIKKPNLFVDFNGIHIQLCLPYYINAKIFRNDGVYKYQICDTKKLLNKNEFIDNKISSNKIYQYSVIPYYQKEDQIYYGNEIFLDKIKSTIYYIDDCDWIN